MDITRNGIRVGMREKRGRRGRSRGAADDRRAESRGKAVESTGARCLNSPHRSWTDRACLFWMNLENDNFLAKRTSAGDEEIQIEGWKWMDRNRSVDGVEEERKKEGSSGRQKNDAGRAGLGQKGKNTA